MPVLAPSTSEPPSSREATLRRSSNTMKKLCGLPLPSLYLQASQRGSASAGRASAVSKQAVPRRAGQRIARRPLPRRHADGAVEADGLAVQHVVLDDLHRELGIFLGIAQPRRE